MLIAMAVWCAVSDREINRSSFLAILWTSVATVLVSGLGKVFLLYPPRKKLTEGYVQYYMYAVYGKVGVMVLLVIFAGVMFEGWAIGAFVILLILHILSAFLLSMRGKHGIVSNPPMQEAIDAAENAEQGSGSHDVNN
jgi:hypothetical protein